MHPFPCDVSEEDFYTDDETCRRSGNRERIQIAAAGKYCEYYKTNHFDYTFAPEESVYFGLAIVARIVAVQQAYAEYANPEIATLVLAYFFGRPLALFKVLGQGSYEKGPSNLQKPNGTISRTSVFRHCVVKLVGSNNILVGFNVAWTLTALQFPLRASRLVEFCAETSYKLICQQLAQDGKTFRKHLFVSHRIPYDRFWAAVCFDCNESPID